MKKILLTILTITYFAASTGATIHFHYCMGKSAGWSLGGPGPKTCGVCGMDTSEEKNGCCKDEHCHVKLEADQQKTEQVNITTLPLSSPVIHIPFLEKNNIPDSKIPEANPATPAPPGITSNKLHLLKRVFQI